MLDLGVDQLTASCRAQPQLIERLVAARGVLVEASDILHSTSEVTILSVPAAYYIARAADFVGEATESILGTLTAKSAFAVDPPQRDAWVSEIGVLKSALAGIDGYVFLEFNVPRIGSRIDAVLVSGPAVFVIEFKVGARHVNTHDFNQAMGLRARLEELSPGQPHGAHSADPRRHGV